ncbi:amine oxidase [flavin-containing] B-like [Branchiostoma floridae x Branchiostoma belcheri]
MEKGILDIDVVVIGAGISGLCAAKLLQESGLDVRVLEARDRVGGRTYTKRDPSYGYVDLGGSYVGPTQDRILRLAKELDLKTYVVDMGEKAVLYFEGVRQTTSDTGTYLAQLNNPLGMLDSNNIFRKIQNLSQQVPLAAPWNAPRAKEWDIMTVQEFINNECWTRITRSDIQGVVQSTFCCEAHEISLLYYLFYMASGQGQRRVISATNGAQERKIVGGAMQVSEKIAALLGDRVVLSSPVLRIDQEDTVAIVTTHSGQQYRAKYVISSVPLPVLHRILFEPPLPAMKLQLVQRMTMGSIIKTNTYYRTAFWKEKGFSGEAQSDIGPVSYCVDDTKPDGSHPAITGFILAGHARDVCEMSPEERKQAVCEYYAEVFQCPEFLHPVNYVEQNWMADPFSGGCFVATLGPGVLTSFGRAIRKPFGKVYFAGTETAVKWNGYMDGAVESGERAAREVLHAMGKISEDQIWQEEPPSPDVPHTPFEDNPLEKILPSVPQFLYILLALVVLLLSVLWVYLF